MHRLLLRRLTSLCSRGRVLVIAGLGLLAGTSSAAPPDLTATAEEYVSSGILYKRLLFKSEKQRGEMELPNGWTHRNVDPTQLQVTPGARPFADAVIRTQSLPAAHAFDEAATRALQQEALAAVPPASQEVTIIRSSQFGDGPGGRESFEVVVSYKALGYAFHRSTMVVNAPDHRLVMQLTAPEADFNALTAAFRRALQSWHWQDL